MGNLQRGNKSTKYEKNVTERNKNHYTFVTIK